ncbi:MULTISPECIES: JAB domain-containing protein [Tenacibaculum]|uniref:DNA repair protein n=2 Tax=Tenacibaculum TaxID=104267 RepID=A0A9X4EQZ2_9FLAO|nr:MULTISPECIES: JAB domain-containing protein [Tenacibaculum]MDE1207798.1 DNA repair protein [Tenacibaculum larymnensis]RLK07146.1 DNA repair protein RadC [Tenacibaculum discolor]
MDIKLTEQEKIKILNSDDIYGIMQRILLRDNKIDQNREHFWVIGLANNNRILFIELISLGTVNATLVEPMEVFSFALQKRAVKIILCHNHPSGELKPSEADKDISDRLIQVGIIVDTEVVDHLIISEKSYLSFGDIGLLDELKKSTKYVPKYVLEQRLKKEATEIAEKKKAIEIAKAFKRSGLDNELIAKNTGLTIEEVEKLRVKRS